MKQNQNVQLVPQHFCRRGVALKLHFFPVVILNLPQVRNIGNGKF